MQPSLITIENRLAIKERIESRILSKDGCWITNYKVIKGRPKIKINSKSHLLSRVVYEIYKGTPPGDSHVCHTCDNPLCINPDHFFLGSHAENMLDRARKNRQAKGSRVGSSKLVESQVLEIRKLLLENKLTCKQIGEKFGISADSVMEINRGTAWTHVKGIGKRLRDKKRNSKLSEDNVRHIKKLLFEGAKSNTICKIFGITKATVSSIRLNKTWNSVKLELPPVQLKIPGLEQFFTK